MAKLDRMLASVEWDLKYPMSKLTILPKNVSDHNPIQLQFGDKPQTNEPIFRFEKWWLDMEDFVEVVQRAWEIECTNTDPISVWQCKIRNLRKKIKGWSKNRDCELKRGKHELIMDLDALDALAETQKLSEGELARRKDLNIKLDRIWRIEETKAWQRSRDRDIKEGDKNTSYFFAKANQRKRKKTITRLEENGMEITDNDKMLKYAVQFYKNLFGKESRENITLEDDFWDDVDKIVVEENELLEAPFSEEEIKKAIDGSYAVGAPSPDGFSFLFYQKFWYLIKADFMAMVRGV
jgi:hypothetical protein